MFLGINRHYRRFARRLRAGLTAARAAGTPENTTLLWVDSIDVATEGALWYSRLIANGGGLRAVATPGKRTDTGLRPRWFDFSSNNPPLEVLPTDEGRTHAMLEEVWRLPRGENRFVTVIVPEQFKRPSLLSAAGRESFRLKLRLLSEPGVVVADVPAVSPTKKPEGHTPSHLA